MKKCCKTCELISPNYAISEILCDYSKNYISDWEISVDYCSKYIPIRIKQYLCRTCGKEIDLSKDHKLITDGQGFYDGYCEKHIPKDFIIPKVQTGNKISQINANRDMIFKIIDYLSSGS